VSRGALAARPAIVCADRAVAARAVRARVLKPSRLPRRRVLRSRAARPPQWRARQPAAARSHRLLRQSRSQRNRPKPKKRCWRPREWNGMGRLMPCWRGRPRLVRAVPPTAAANARYAIARVLRAANAAPPTPACAVMRAIARAAKRRLFKRSRPARIDRMGDAPAGVGTRPDDCGAR
jgi:hypothetical protein